MVVNVQGDGAEDGDQKASSHQRQASRSYETFHKQKSSDPTYDRVKYILVDLVNTLITQWVAITHNDIKFHNFTAKTCSHTI